MNLLAISQLLPVVLGKCPENNQEIDDISGT